MVAAVADRGYAETRVVDVVDRAGVSRATFYDLFDDLEDCFLTTYDHVSGRMLDTATAAFNGHSGAAWSERIRSSAAAVLELLAAWPQGARFAVVEVLAAGRNAHLRRDAVVRRFAELVDEGRGESPIQPPGFTSVAVIGAIQELLFSELIRSNTPRLELQLPEIVYLIMQPFLGSEAAATERERARGSLPRAA